MKKSSQTFTIKKYQNKIFNVFFISNFNQEKKMPEQFINEIENSLDDSDRENSDEENSNEESSDKFCRVIIVRYRTN